LSEEPEIVWRDRKRRIPIEVPWIRIWPAIGKAYDKILEYIRQAEEDIVILDNTRMLGIKEENNAGHVHERFAPVIAACREMKDRTLIAIHHANKVETDDIIKTATGSHAFAGLVDVAVTIKKPSKARQETERQIDSIGRIDKTQVICDLQNDNYVMVDDEDKRSFRDAVRLVKAYMNDIWQSAADITKAIKQNEEGEYLPSPETIRRSLKWLVQQAGTDIETDTDPSNMKQGRTPKYRFIPPPGEQQVSLDDIQDTFGPNINMPYKDS
jgi:hypothetical protein